MSIFISRWKNCNLHYCLFQINEKKPSIVDFFFFHVVPKSYRTVTSVYRATPYIYIYIYTVHTVYIYIQYTLYIVYYIVRHCCIKTCILGMVDVYVGVNYYVWVFTKPIHLEIGTVFLVDKFYIVFKCIFVYLFLKMENHVHPLSRSIKLCMYILIWPLTVHSSFL